MGLEVPKSANSNQPAQRPLPDVDPQWLLMAAAHMQSIGKFDPFTGSAYNSESKFSDAEISKNLEERKEDPEMKRLADSIDTTLKSASSTPADLSLEARSMTATSRGAPRRNTTPR